MLKDKIRAEIERTGVGGKQKEMAQVREYVTAVENSLPLMATDLRDGFRKIADYGGIVLAGCECPEKGYGYKFVTWQYTYDRTAVTLGHYYDSYYPHDTNAFEKAKQDFAVRSGLVDENLILKPDQYVDIYEALDFCLRIGMTPTQEKNIEMIMEQLERLLPELPGQEEPTQGPKLGH